MLWRALCSFIYFYVHFFVMLMRSQDVPSSYRLSSIVWIFYMFFHGSIGTVQDIPKHLSRRFKTISHVQYSIYSKIIVLWWSQKSFPHATRYGPASRVLTLLARRCWRTCIKHHWQERVPLGGWHCFKLRIFGHISTCLDCSTPKTPASDIHPLDSSAGGASSVKIKSGTVEVWVDFCAMTQQVVGGGRTRPIRRRPVRQS